MKGRIAKMEEEVKEGELPKEKEDSGSITLSREEYAKMLTDMATTKSLVQQLQERSKELEEKTSRSAPELEEDKGPVDTSKMTQKDVIDFVISHVGQPLLNQIMTTNIKLEVMEVKEEFGKVEFEALKDEIYKIASKNSTMSIRDAFLLAKQQFPDKLPKPKQEEKKSEEKAGIPPGEKKGVSPKGMQATTKMSARDAALKALQEIDLNLEE